MRRVRRRGFRLDTLMNMSSLPLLIPRHHHASTSALLGALYPVSQTNAYPHHDHVSFALYTTIIATVPVSISPSSLDYLSHIGLTLFRVFSHSRPCYQLFCSASSTQSSPIMITPRYRTHSAAEGCSARSYIRIRVILVTLASHHHHHPPVSIVPSRSCMSERRTCLKDSILLP